MFLRIVCLLSKEKPAVRRLLTFSLDSEGNAINQLSILLNLMADLRVALT
jgi:hypothetical protein